MKIEVSTYDISWSVEESLPKLLIFFDWFSFISAPVHRSVRIEGKRGFQREFQDQIYHHYLNIKFGIGRRGVDIEFKYKPFRYVPTPKMVYSDILKREKEKIEYVRKYL